MTTSDPASSDRLVLDTHVWVWASGEGGGPTQLSRFCREAIEAAARDRRLYVCAASVWEIGLKAERGRAIVRGDLAAWVRDQTLYPGIRVLSIDARLAIESTRLPRWMRMTDGREHRDPNDRFIVAAARRLNGLLVTCDQDVLAYGAQGHVRTYDGG